MPYKNSPQCRADVKRVGCMYTTVSLEFHERVAYLSRKDTQAQKKNERRAHS